MFKRFLLGIIVAVMVIVPAFADMLPLDKDFFSDRIKKEPPAASITLSPSQDEANTLELTIKSEVSRAGYRCEIVEVSGDVRTHFSSAAISCSWGTSRHYITFPVPEEGQTAHYRVTVFFKPITGGRDSVHFYREAAVQNVDGRAYIIIEE